MSLLTAASIATFTLNASLLLRVISELAYALIFEREDANVASIVATLRGT